MPTEVFKNMLTSSSYGEDFSHLVDENLELDPVAGEKVITTLDPEEIRDYRNLLGIRQRFMDITEDLREAADISVALSITDGGKSLQDSLSGVSSDPEVQSLLHEWFYMDALWQKVRSVFWFNIRQRTGCFTKFLEVRAGYSVVELGSKAG